MLLLYHISEGNIVPFTPIQLFGSSSYFLHFADTVFTFKKSL